LLDALEWFAPQANLELVFADQSARARAIAIVLHGTADDLSPRDAISAVLIISDLKYRIGGGYLWIASPDWALQHAPSRN
jgi:hypothetical protein